MKNNQLKFKNIHFTSTLSMSLVLFLVGLVSLMVFVARDAAVMMKENITLSIILDDDISNQGINRIEDYLKSTPYTKSTNYISKEEALKDHIQSLGDDPEKFLGFNPLLASIEVHLNAGYANPDSVKMIETRLKSFEHIEKIAYQKDMVSLVNDNVRKVSTILLGIAVVLLLVSIALINNTIKLSVYSNRFLINTMKLVGATSWFIRKPYVKTGIINGIIAGIISIILLTLVVFYVQYEFGISGFALNPGSAIYVSLIVLISGIGLSALSAYLSVGKYLKINTNDLYLV
jgi:cell division transport system permease protein